eukprot:CFRG0294T1
MVYCTFALFHPLEQKATAYSENKYSKEIYSVNTSGTENHRSNEYKRFKISIFAISATALSAVVFFSVATSTNAWMIIPPSDPVTPSANQYGLYEGCYADTSGQEECGTIAVSCMIDCAHSIIPHICDKYEPVMSCDSFFAIRIVVVLVGALVLISPIAMLVTSGMGHQPKRVATTTICFYGLGIILSILAIFMFVFTEYEPHKKKLAAIDTKPHDSPHREISMGFSFWCMLGSIACQMITWGTMVYVVLHEYNLYRLHEKRSAAMIVDHVVLEGD